MLRKSLFSAPGSAAALALVLGACASGPTLERYPAAPPPIPTAGFACPDTVDPPITAPSELDRYYRHAVGIVFQEGADGRAFRETLRRIGGTVVGGAAATNLCYVRITPTAGAGPDDLVARLGAIKAESPVDLVVPLGYAVPVTLHGRIRFR